MTDNETRQPRPRRLNGLTKPYTTAQVSTWVALPTLAFEFVIIVSPLLPIAASIPCTLLYMLSASASAYFAILAMTIDPSDPRLELSKQIKGGTKNGTKAMNNNEENDDVETTTTPPSFPNGEHPWDPNETTKHCWICRHDVSEKSMHCKFCNKCVHTFDHHCMWLNTCVGSANYEYFFRTMISIATMLFLHCSIQIGLLCGILIGESGTSDVRDRAETFFGSSSTKNGSIIASITIMGIFILFDVLALSLIIQLLSFHLHLRKQGLTTYQFIYKENRKKSDLRKLQRTLEQKRIVAMGKAHEEGRTCDWYQLRMGGILREKIGCTKCDPLSLEEETKKKEEKEKAPQEQEQQQKQSKPPSSAAQETVVVQTNGNGTPAVSEGGGGGEGVSFVKVNNNDKDPEESKQPETEEEA